MYPVARKYDALAALPGQALLREDVDANQLSQTPPFADVKGRTLQDYFCVDRRHCLGVTPSRRRIVVQR